MYKMFLKQHNGATLVAVVFTEAGQEPVLMALTMNVNDDHGPEATTCFDVTRCEVWWHEIEPLLLAAGFTPDEDEEDPNYFEGKATQWIIDTWQAG